MPPLNHQKFLRGSMPRTHVPNDVSSTERFLRDRVLSVDVFALRREATGTLVAPLSVENSIGLNLGEKVTVEVIEFRPQSGAHIRAPLAA
jgi:hypothetical protein